MGKWQDSAKQSIVNRNSDTSSQSNTKNAGAKSSGSWQQQAKHSLDSRGYIPPENRAYEIKLNNGTNFGTVSYGAYKAIQNDTLDKYVPKNDDEKNTLDSFKAYVKEQAQKQEEKEKQNRINSNPVTKKYGIDSDNFTQKDFEKWAEEHGFEYRMGGNDLTGAEYKWLPKQKGGWKFWEVVPSKEEQSDKKALEALAENNQRKAALKTDKGAVSAAVVNAIDGLTFGAVNAYADWDAKRDYKKAGFDENDFVSYSQAQEKTNSEHKIASAAGNIAGSLVSLGGLSKAVGAATSGVKWIAKAPGWVQSAINSGITFAVQSGAETAFDGGNFEDVLKSAGINLVGGAVGGGVSSAVGKIAEKLVFSKKLQENAISKMLYGEGKTLLQHKIFPAVVEGGAKSAAFAGAKTASTYFLYPEDYRPTKEEMAKDITTAFAFGAISSGINTIKTSSQNKKYLDGLYQKMAADYESMAKANISGKDDTAGIQKFAKNVIGYSNAMEAYLTGKEYNATIDGETYTFTPNKVRLVGQDKYVNSILGEIDTIRNNANAVLNGIETPSAGDSTASSPTNAVSKSAGAIEQAASVAIPNTSNDTASSDSSIPIVTNVAAAETVTPQNKSTVDTAVIPQTTVKAGASEELSEIMDSEPIATFTPETASNEIKRLENILIAKGADDTSRKEIIDTAVEIEKTLDGSDKNIRSVFYDVSKITSTAISELQNQVGLSSAYWKLFGENFKTVPTGNAKENINLVTEYSNAYAEALKNNNPEKYNSVMLSADGQDLSAELPKTIMQNNIPNTVQNAGQYRLIATQIKNIINAADVQLESERNEIYGDNANTTVENNAESTEVQTITEPKNITLTRMGDFYEAFGDEALELAEKLNLTPTYKTVNGVKTAMVGFPVHVLEKYQGALGNDYNLIISDNAADTIADNAPDIPRSNTDTGNIKTAQNSNNDDYDVRNTYEIMDNLGLTYDEQRAILEYKSSRSYTLNNDLRDGVTLSEEQITFKNDLINALDKFPVYSKTVYRSIGFSEQEDFDDFIAKHKNKDVVNYPYFLSASKAEDGYAVKADFVVHYEIESKNAKDVEQIGLTEEKEVLFKTDTAYAVDEFTVDGNNINIKMREIDNNATSNRTDKNERNKSNVASGSADIENQRTNEEVYSTNDILRGGSATNAEVYSEQSASDGQGSGNGSVENSGRNEIENRNAAVSEGVAVRVNYVSHLTDKCELVTTKHTKTNDDLWVVTLKEKLSAEDYKTLNGKVKEAGGYYSKFAKTPDGKAIPGFVFKTEPTEKELSVFNDFFDKTAVNDTPQAESSEATPDNADVESTAPEVENKPDLKVGDVIEYEGKQWRVAQTGFNMSFENLDKSDKQSVFSHIGGMDNFKATHDYKLVSDDTPTDVTAESEKNAAETQTKTEEALKKEPESDIIKKNPTTQIADYVTDKLTSGEKITALELSKVSSEAFGGTMADNAYNIKDAYDAMELGVNKYILSMKDVSAEKMLELLKLLPTQTKRTEEMVKYQQFSTPPSIAYLANYAANISSKDTMLEPSAGIGGIAVFAKRDGATVYVNELDNRRLEILKNMPFDKFFNENAEQLDNILGGEIEPSVIVMNPPFSSSSERNMQNTKIGAKHIEQALKILSPNGRLVAIVGHGMADDAPAFKSWWKDIKSQYNVKANIRINGKNYNKYGTNFDIQMLVIDKNGATTHTETGYVDTLQELQEKLEVIRDERPLFNYSGNEQRTPATARTKVVETRESGVLGERTLSDNSGVEDKGRHSGDVRNAQRNGGKSVVQEIQSVYGPSGTVANRKSENTDVVADGRQYDGRSAGGHLGGNAELQNGGRTDSTVGAEHSIQIASDRDNGNARAGQNNVRVQRLKKKELTDNIFEQYQPQPLKLKNTKPHPGKVNESAAMSAIEPPVITYKPNIPQNVVESGTLSDVQLEAVSYAGQSHSQTLPDGTARGFFLGDGTGIGKGRTIAGMILDNYNQGRKKSLWVTSSPSLVNDAKRDVKAVFGNPDLVTQFVGGKKADSVLNTDEAVMVVSYPSLSTGYDKIGSNFEKIVNWLGKDFDGLIVFDESHKMGNAKATKGTRGTKQASQTGLAGIALQEALPKAKIVYSSATGATEVENLRYAERLGLWGEGTAFATGDDFVSKIKAGGLAAMELIARDMKAMGVYLSRNISYEDVRYDKITHKLSREQKKIYDELARSWQIVLSNINKALEGTNQSKDGKARGKALGAFWSSQQRFFNQILTSMQVPSVISDIEKQLADGKSCVIQLVSTNEAAQNEEFARLKENDLELDEFDLTPKQMLMSYIENSFPVQQFEEYRDDDGNVRSKPAFDSKGNPVLNRDAVRQREELLSKLGSIKVPSSPIDMIINHFGTDMVAENTGRARRVVQKDGKLVEEKIGSKKDADVDAFQNGKKRIIIFSKAGGTGKSYHADRAAKNQQQRVHYLLEAGWQADNAVQGFGRSHRSNQAIAPIFKLVTTDLKGQMRFISTIAKRLDQLGAMTKGQRQAGGQGMFSASDNLENSFAADVLAVFYKDLILNRVDGIDDGLEIISKLGLKNKILNEYNQVMPTASELREVNKFLNRILSLESSEQNIVFEGYQQRLQDATEKAMLAGTLDKGLENYRADRITLNEVKDIRENERSGAKTKYYNLTAEHKIKPVKFEDIPTESKSFVGYYQNKTTGNVRAVVRTSSITDQYGNVTDNFKLIGQVKNDYIAQNRFYGNWTEIKADEVEKLWNEEITKLPEYRKESLHLISGVVLPVWDKLPTENVRIYRVLTSDGEMLIGRVIPEDRIDEVLRRLGSSRKKEKIATKDLISGIKNGDTVYLENDWKIVQRKVSGENRIEVVGPTYENYDSLTKKGVFTERIQYNTRYFVPADTNTEKTIDELLKLSPVMRVENAKYSISESEDFINEQSGSSILSGNSGRTIDESAGGQAKRVSSYKQKLEGKTTTERKSTAKELAVKGYTEEVVSGNHKYTLIKDEGYNDDMRSIVSEAKAYGKEVGFFIGNAVRKFDGQRNFKIDGIKLSDNKILIRYDGTYSPQALLMHELVHTEWGNPEMQKAKDIILSDLSESDKKEILQNGRYKDYMELYNGDEDAIWEEFIADIFADMNKFSDSYIDTAVDYWYNDKVIDRYNPSEYIKSTDAGGNEAVLNNIGLGNEYSLSGNSFDIPYNEKRQLDDYVLRKNHSSNKLEKVDCKEIGNNFYAWKNNSKTEYDIVLMIEIDGNEDLIAEVREGVKNGDFRRTKNVNKWSADVRSGRGNNSIFNGGLERATTNGSDDRFSVGQSKSNTRGYSFGSSTNKTTKYALNSYDTDSESLTPERKKAIFEQWEKDHAGLEKPTKRQLWGERAEWVAHNMTRVFPNIPERGEKGTFFAEFRTDMIQWKNLPTTASFMVRDKLNKMTEGLTPKEFKTFSELVYFLDLQEEAQIQKDRGYDEILLPNEITPKEVDKIVNVLNEEATDKVQQALIKRQNIWDELKQQYIDLNSYIGFDTDGKFKRKNYYHHQVIDYMNKDKGGTGSREIGIKAGRGWLKERQGSTKAINTDFLAVEYKAMMQMQYDVYIAETLGKIKQQYDIKPKLEKEAFEHNKKALNDIIQKECTDDNGNVMLDKSGKPDSETYRKQKWYNARIMWGFNGLFDLAERGELSDYDGEYTNVIETLKKHDLNADGLYKYVGILSNIELPGNATDGQEQAVQNARTALKYTAQKKAWIKELLADDYQTWETLAKSMSDTHTVHQPRRGNYFYTKTILDEDAFNKAHDDMVLSLVSGEVDLGNVDVKKLFEQYSDTVRLTGATYEQWVLPKEIVTTMDEIANPKQASEGAKVARSIVSAWKGWATSVNPLRTVKFGLRNLAGDLDAVIAGNPKVMLYSKQAMQEIYRAMKHKNYSDDFMEWVKRGGYTSMIFANEMDTEMQDKLFSHLKDKQGTSIFKIPVKAFEKYYDGVENVHNFREAILRYSAYLYFKDEINKNGGKVKDYVASNKYIVKGLNSTEDKAYQLSKDLLGAYDEVGKLGQTLRRYWIPFYSFTETNMKRYYRMFKNIITSDDEIPKKAGKLLLKALMANMLMLITIAWNKLVMKEQDDKLPPSTRDVPHITFGQIGDNVYAFRQLGSFSELLEWVGLDDYKWTKEDLTAPVDKAWGMITPFVKMPVELASGLNFYPSLTQPRAIRDKWQHFFNSLGVDDVYNEVTGKPTRGVGEILKGSVIYNYDYKESAYYEILDIKREWQGSESGSIYKATPKSNALYYMKTAVRYKDKEAALKYLDEYFENGGTAKGIKQSIATLNPMHGFTGKDTVEQGNAFIASLSDEEKEKLKIAQDFYENDLMLPQEVTDKLGKKDITDEEAKNLLRNYINAKCK